MDVYHSLSGMVVAELTAADPSGALLGVADAGVRIYDVISVSDLTVSVTIRRMDASIVRSLCRKRGYSFRILKREGFYWHMVSSIKRPVLLAGCLILLFLILALPTRVLFVKVEGNERIPSRQVIEAAENCGITFGASRRKVRSEQIKNALLQTLPELQWAGVNTSGCVAMISVREKIESVQLTEQVEQSNIVAAREGIILSCTATRGNLLCQPGQAVAKGQILISGYTDCGLKIQICSPEGEIMAKTIRHLEVISPAIWLEKGNEKEIHRTVSLLIGKKRINLWKDSGIWDGSCGRIYEENYITLPGGFRLPFGWAVDTLLYADCAEMVLPLDQIPLEAFAKAYLTQHMVGGTVLSQNSRVTVLEDHYRLAGEYVCAEMIGSRQAQKIGEVHGKSG